MSNLGQRCRYEQVADLAGVHRTSVYRNWPDRDELVSEAMLQFGRDAAPVHDTGDIRRDLVSFVVAQAAILGTPTGRALGQILQQAPDSPAIQHVQAAYANERQAALQQRLDRAVGQGQLPAVDAEFLAHLLSGPVHFHVLWTDRPLTRAYAERIVDVVLTGIRRRLDKADKTLAVPEREANMAGEAALDRCRRGAFGLVVVAAFGCASGPTPR